MFANSRRAMNAAWALAAVIALVDLVWLPFSGLRVDPLAAMKLIGIGVGVLALSMVYTRLRPNPVFASLLESAAFLVLFTLALAISSYLATSLARPTWDHVFDAEIGRAHV